MGADLQVDLGFVMRTVFIALVVFTSSMSGMLLLLATATAFTGKVRNNLSSGREFNFLWGLSFLSTAALAALVLNGIGEAGFIVGIVLFAGVLALVLMGLAVVSSELGLKIGRLHSGREWSPLTAFLVGGTVMLSSTLIPVLGWILFAYFLINGLGAVLRVLATGLLGSRQTDDNANISSTD